MIDIDNIKKKYDENGFVIINEDHLKNEKIFNEIEEYFEKKFLKFNDNKSYKNLNLDFRSESFFLNDVSYVGWSKEQILFRGQSKNFENRNCLEGKRGVLDILNIDNPVVKIIENEKILNLAKRLLNSEEVILLNGSFAASYPSNLGEGKRFHCDITAFNNNRKIDELIKNKIHVCNIMIYVSDVNLDNAPMRVLPDSHKKYNEINKLISNSTKIPLEKSYIPQAYVAFDEILEDANFKYLEGRKGSITAMNSFSIHSATENYSKDKTRKVVILNYGPKNCGLRKRKMKQACKQKFYNYINQKNLFEYNTFDYKHIKEYFATIIQTTKSFLSNLIKLNFIRHKFSKLKITLIDKISGKKVEKVCLNIGAGGGWYHPDYVTLDAIKNKYINNSIVQDIVKNPILPFKDNSFSAVYSSHCFEHLLEKDLLFALKEIKRILKPDGVLRIVVPNIRLFFEAYDRKDMSFFSWTKDNKYYKYDSWLRLISRSVYEPVVNYLSDEELKSFYMKSKHYRQFCRFLIDKAIELNLEEKESDNYFPDNHKNYFDEEIIKNYLNQFEFKNIEISKPRNSKYKYFQNTKLLRNIFDNTRPHMSLYVECNK